MHTARLQRIRDHRTDPQEVPGQRRSTKPTTSTSTQSATNHPHPADTSHRFQATVRAAAKRHGDTVITSDWPPNAASPATTSTSHSHPRSTAPATASRTASPPPAAKPTPAHKPGRHYSLVAAGRLDGIRRQSVRRRPAALHPGPPPGPRGRGGRARLLCPDHDGDAVAAAELCLRGCRHDPGRLRTGQGPGRLTGPEGFRDPPEPGRGSSGSEPAWIDFYHHARLSADAAEVFRGPKNPTTALAWNQQTAAMPTGVLTRSVGMRLTIVGTAHLQARDLDQGLELWNSATVRVHPRPRPVQPGQGLRPRVQHRTRTELGIAA